LSAEAKRPLNVEAHDLLPAADVTHFRRRRVMSLPDEAALDPVLGDQRTGDKIAGLVVPERPDQQDLAAQRDNVARHIGRPAEHNLLGLMMKDRNWRFRRNPLDASIDVLVEHHVAKNEDPHSPPLGDP
jgi:hypothetical protein